MRHTDIDIHSAANLAQEQADLVELAIIDTMIGVEKEQKWAQEAPRLILAFLIQDDEDSTYEDRKNILISHTKRVISWIKQDDYEYQRIHPTSFNRLGGSVTALRSNTETTPIRFIKSCVYHLEQRKQLLNIIADENIASILNNKDLDDYYTKETIKEDLEEKSIRKIGPQY